MKIDIGVSRSATISLPNYKSIKPTVSITAKDVDVTKADAVYNQISKVLDAMYGLEFLSLINELDSMQQMGMTAYVEAMHIAEDRMNTILERFGVEISAIVGERTIEPETE